MTLWNFFRIFIGRVGGCRVHNNGNNCTFPIILKGPTKKQKCEPLMRHSLSPIARQNFSLKLELYYSNIRKKRFGKAWIYRNLFVSLYQYMGDISKTRTMHLIGEIHRDVNGDYYVVTTPHAIYPTPIRKEYLAIGHRLIYPKVWGRKKGALELLNQKKADQIRIIERAKAEIDRLDKCIEQTEGWKDD